MSGPDVVTDRANQIARSGVLLAGLAGCGFVLTIGWNLSLAALFGTSGDLDAFWIGLAIPKAVAETFHAGILTLLFVLVFNLQAKTSISDDPWRLASTAFNLAFVLTILGIGLTLAGAPYLVKLMGPGLDPGLQERSASFLRVLSLIMIPTLFVGAFSGALNAHRRFIPVALSRVVGMSVQLLVLFLLADTLRVKALVWAIVLGALGMFLVCFPPFLKIDFRYTMKMLFRTPGARSVFRLFVALALITFHNPVNQMSDRFFASMLGEGAVSTLEFGWRFEIPITQILGFSIALPSFVLMALQASESGLHEFRRTLIISVRLVALLVVPVLGFLLVLRQPVTSLWFERGLFTQESSSLVASLIPPLAVVFCLKAFGSILVFALLSLHRIRPILWILAFELIANTLLNALLSPSMGLHGIALATAAAATVSNLWLWLLLLRELGEWSAASVAGGAKKILLINACSIGFLQILHLWLASWDGLQDHLSIVVYLVGVGLAYMLLYALLSKVFGLIDVSLKNGFPRIRLSPSEWSAVPREEGITRPRVD